MKNVLFLLLLLLFIPSCTKEEAYHEFCYECTAIIYGKAINDYVCYPDPTEIERYKLRLYEFYEGGCTNVECELLEDPFVK